MSYGRRGQADHEGVGVPGCARAGCEPLEPSGNLCCGTAKCVDARLGAAYVQQVARCLDLEPRGEPVCDVERLVDATRVDQRIDSGERDQVDDLGESAGGCEGCPGVELVEGRLRPFVGPQLDAEVVVEDSHFSSLSGVGRQPDCLAHVVEATRIADSSASEAEVAERARRSLQPELIGKRDCSFGGGECSFTAAVEKVGTRDLGQRLDVRAPLRERIQQRQASPGSSTQRGSARRERRLASTCMACAMAGRSPRS